MEFLAISYSFPSFSRPYSGVFVKNTLDAMASLDHDVTAIVPQRLFRDRPMPRQSIEGRLRVLRPSFFSAGSFRLLKWNSYSLTQNRFERAVIGAVKVHGLSPCAVYSHFMLPSGFAALQVARLLNSRAFCALGESDLTSHEGKISRLHLTDAFREFDGLIFNSPHTMKVALDRYKVEREKCIVIPNGVDDSRFYPRDKLTCRHELGLPVDEKIVIFVGSFIDRKGPMRVARACARIRPPPKLVFLGDGPQVPSGEHVLFAGAVKHERLPYYLAASDVFALPTVSEGMSNAVLEALACGVTIVTSRIESNQRVLGENHPYYCEPMSETDLRDKILLALLNPVGNERKPARLLDRGRAIMQFVESRR